jgi:hypothetical protein
VHLNGLCVLASAAQVRPVLQAHRWRVLLVRAVTSLLLTSWLLAVLVRACLLAMWASSKSVSCWMMR